MAALVGGGISVGGIGATGWYRLKEVDKQNQHDLDVRRLEYTQQREQQFQENRRAMVREWRQGLAEADARYEAEAKLYAAAVRSGDVSDDGPRAERVVAWTRLVREPPPAPLR